jgi:hypothetical protein
MVTDGIGRGSVEQPPAGNRELRGEFSNAARSCVGKGVARYTW